MPSSKDRATQESVECGERPVILMAFPPEMRSQFFTAETMALLSQHADIAHTTDHSRIDDLDDPATLSRVRVVMTSWGSQTVDTKLALRMPNLGAVIHTGGSIHNIVSPTVMASGIVVSSQSDTNAILVAEYTLAMIILSLKGVLIAQAEYAARRETIPVYRRYERHGTTGKTVGIIGASRVGQRVILLLQNLGVRVKVSDPFLDPARAEDLGVERVELEDLMSSSDVISIHAPANPTTRHLVSRAQIARMKNGATLINTARGSLVDESALEDALESGRISAVLDVTEPAVPRHNSPLWTLPNVLLTPHVAGALGSELSLLGRHASEEAVRFLRGAPLHSEVATESLEHIA